MNKRNTLGVLVIAEALPRPNKRPPRGTYCHVVAFHHVCISELRAKSELVETALAHLKEGGPRRRQQTDIVEK